VEARHARDRDVPERRGEARRAGHHGLRRGSRFALAAGVQLRESVALQDLVSAQALSRIGDIIIFIFNVQAKQLTERNIFFWKNQLREMSLKPRLFPILSESLRLSLGLCRVAEALTVFRRQSCER
jgi:hypothetical protein